MRQPELNGQPEGQGGEPLTGISIASSPQDFEEIYRLRYKVFSLEYGDHRHSCRERGIYTDEFDSVASTQFVARDGGKIVGSLRVVPMAGIRYFDYNEHFPAIAGALGMTGTQLEERSAVVSRGVIIPEYRGGDLFQRLLDVSEKFCLRSGWLVQIAAVSLDNPGCLRFLLRRGFISHGPIRMSGGWNGTILYKTAPTPDISCK